MLIKLAQEVKDDTWAFTAKMNEEATRRLQAIQQQEAKYRRQKATSNPRSKSPDNQYGKRWSPGKKLSGGVMQ